MLKKSLFLILLLIPFTVALTFVIKNPSGSSPAPEKITDFTLPDVNGKKHSLSDYKDSKVIVVMFIATQCPISNAYNSRMVDIYKKYKDKNITFIGINSNKQESIDEVKSHAEDNGFKFTVLKDDKNKIADMFRASVTPEIFILKPDGYTLLYQGRIDDSRDESDVDSRDLSKALDEILAGKAVSAAKTKAFGCTIKRV
jgi:peroxiredoxin